MLNDTFKDNPVVWGALLIVQTAQYSQTLIVRVQQSYDGKGMTLKSVNTQSTLSLID